MTYTIKPPLIVAAGIALFDQTTKDLPRRMAVPPWLMLVVFEYFLDRNWNLPSFGALGGFLRVYRIGSGSSTACRTFLHECPNFRAIALNVIPSR